MPERLKNFNSISENSEIVTEQTINKSRFISCAHRIESQSDAEEIVARLKKEHYKANHICSAWILATDPLTQKASDDGEPSGTAGRPILDVIEKKGLKNVLVTVVRYFGGIKLGSGGLVRAYSSSARDAIDASERVVVEESAVIDLEIEYSLYQTLKLMLEKHNIFPVEESFTDLVKMRFYIPVEKRDSFTNLISDFTNGSFLMETVETRSTERLADRPEYIL